MYNENRTDQHQRQLKYQAKINEKTLKIQEK